MSAKTVTQELADATARIGTIETQLATITGERDAAIQAKDTLTAEVSTLKGKLSTAEAAAKTAGDSLTAAQAEIAQLKADAKTAGQKAAEILGNRGTTPANLADETVPQTKDELWAEYKTIAKADPVKARAFYTKNKDRM